MSSNGDARKNFTATFKRDQHLYQEQKSVAIVTRRPAAAAVIPGSAAPCWTTDPPPSIGSTRLKWADLVFDPRRMADQQLVSAPDQSDGNDQPGGEEKRDEKKEETKKGGEKIPEEEALKFPGKFSDERDENKVERGSEGGQEGEGRSRGGPIRAEGSFISTQTCSSSSSGRLLSPSSWLSLWQPSQAVPASGRSRRG